MIKTNIIEPGSIVEFVLDGQSSLDEVLAIINSHYCNFSKGVLWNYKDGSNLSLSANDMTRIAQMVKKCAIHKKTAYVCSADVEFGILRMYSVYASMEHVSPTMKIFRDRAEAIEWINN